MNMTKQGRLSNAMLDTIHEGDATRIPLDDNFVHLVVLSPPYNVGIEYDSDPTGDSLEFHDYIEFTRRWMREIHRVLVNGGRACINIAGINRKPYIPWHSFVIQIAMELGFLMRGRIIWIKEGRASTDWGSWCSPSNPVLRDHSEDILVFSKGKYKLDRARSVEPDITKEEFLEYTRTLWYIRPETSSWHPAAFPLEIPSRCIKLYTFPGQVVLDPFCGSGTTCIAAKRLGRRYIGFDRSKKYVEYARSRFGGNLWA